MGACSGKPKKSEISQPPPQQKLQIQNQELNISPDIFVSLKSGSISQFYKVGDVLGEGAFGCVRLVQHKTTGMQRAMKQINKSKIIKEDEDQMFAEVSILKQLDHPNIVKLYDLYQDNKNYYLITEYLDGGEIFEKIKSLSQFSEKMAADYMKQILSAIVYCHQKKIVHRDLKPENLLLESKSTNSNLKVIDFGTSRKIEPEQKLTKRLGTPYYIAPEVLKKNYDEKCDVWSCGVILYIMLCGYPPFNGEEDEILRKIEIGKFQFDPEEWGKISEEAKSLVRKMLEYDPKKRISSFQALNDPWVQKLAPNIPLDQKSLTNLTGFQNKNKLKCAIMQFISIQILTNQEKEELMKQFKSIDKDSNGELSKDELIEGYMKQYGVDKETAIATVSEIFKQVDVNNSGKIDFTEFVVAAINKDKLLSKQKLDKAFKMFDVDGNGQISKDELKEFLGGASIEEKQLLEIIEQCDKNGDGQINKEEFMTMMLKKEI